jgi:hypothetical protein
VLTSKDKAFVKQFGLSMFRQAHLGERQGGFLSYALGDLLYYSGNHLDCFVLSRLNHSSRGTVSKGEKT